MAFTEKLITVQFSLANGVFQGGGNSATLSGLRCSAKIENAGPPSMGTLDLSIYGMTLSMMNQLSTLGTQVNLISKNSITLQAGDAASGLSTVFQGTIGTAWVDAQAMPQVAFRIMAFAGLFNKVAPADSTSINGSGDVATMMQGFASQMGFSFENNGVSAKLANPYFSGSAWNQAQACAAAGGIEWDIVNGTLAIWPTSGNRSGAATQISPQTGMVGYPGFNQAGVAVKTLFNPTLRRGGLINVQSDLTPACGKWVVLSLDLDLESQVFGGQWFARMTASRIGYSEQP